MLIKRFFFKKSLLFTPIVLLGCVVFFQYNELNKREQEITSVRSELALEKEKYFILDQKNQQTKVDKEILFQEILKEKTITSRLKEAKSGLIASQNKINLLESTTHDLSKKLNEFKSTNQELYQLNENVLSHAEQVLKTQRENIKISSQILDANAQMLQKFDKDNSSNLKFVDLKIKPYFISSNNKQVYTNHAGDINFLNFNFKILRNPYFKANYVELYIQVIDSNGQIIFSKQLQNNLLKNQFYTEYSRVFYNNFELTVSQNVFIKKVNPGSHTINIIHNDQIVLSDKIDFK